MKPYIPSTLRRFCPRAIRTDGASAAVFVLNKPLNNVLSVWIFVSGSYVLTSSGFDLATNIVSVVDR